MTIQFEGSTATVTKATPPSTRRLAAILTGVMALRCLVSLWFGASELSILFWIGAGIGVFASFGLWIAVAPDQRIMFDARSGVISIGERYPWQTHEMQTKLRFSAGESIGLNYRPDEEVGDTYVVALRL